MVSFRVDSSPRVRIWMSGSGASWSLWVGTKGGSNSIRRGTGGNFLIFGSWALVLGMTKGLPGALWGGEEPLEDGLARPGRHTGSVFIVR